MTARLSPRAFIADVSFIDGSKRSIDYDGCQFTSTGVMFDTGDGTCTWVNLATIQSLDTMKAAEPTGAAQ